MTKFQFYPARVDTNRPIDWITLEQFIVRTTNPDEKTKQVFNTIAQAEKDGDMEKKARMKQNYLHYFTPCVYVRNYRRYKDIIRFTGLAVLDFDHIDNALDLKSFLFYEYKQIIASWLSPSKRGVKCLVKIPVVKSVDEFKEYYYGLSEEMEIYNGFDGTGQNAVLPLFQSWDANLMYRDDAETWSAKGIKHNSFENSEPLEKPVINDPGKYTERVVKIITSGVNKITDVGHWDLRGTALAAGGYVCSGYIDQLDAVKLMDSLIDSHPYLRQKAATYKKTIRWGISVGQNKPIIL